MKRYSAESLPSLWWLSPWSTCREMHGMLRAYQSLAEVDERANQILKADVLLLRRRVAELEDGLDRLHTAIITGGAIVPDAKPEDASHE